MKRILATLALLAVPVLFVLLADTHSAQAQDRQPQRRPRVIVLPEIGVPGRVQKPKVFYVLQRARLAPEERDLRTGLLREVVRTVERAPF